MTTPLVSMVMPVWRPQRDWLLQAVESALSQRDCELELIVVDDGNPEPVEELLAGVRDPALRVVRAAHGGPSAARNAGVEEARGRLIRFVDADDVYEPGSTARLARLIGDDDGVIAYGRTVFCDERLRPVWTMSCELAGWIAAEAVLGHFRVRIQSLLFPASVVRAAGPWDPTFPVCHDLEFIARTLEHARAKPDPAVATWYRKHGDSVTSAFERGDDDIQRVIDGYLERHPERRGGAFERRAVASRHAVAARARATRGMAGPALGRLARSLALDPREAVLETWAALPALRGYGVSRLKRPGAIAPSARRG